MAHIVIVGGGFGAVYTALGLYDFLKDHPEHKVILIAEKPIFVFTPLLHEVAAGIIDPTAIQVMLKTLLSLPTYQFLNAKVSSISFAQKTIMYNKKKISFDILILAYGTKARAKKNALKSLSDARTICAALSHLPRNAHIGIVGAGPTGVELAAELAQRFQITIFQKGPEILPAVAPKFRRKVEELLAKKNISIRTNARVTSHMPGIDYLIWCTGSKPIPLTSDKNIYNTQGEIIVDKTLRVADAVFALGDCTAADAPKLAQAAEQQASIVVKNIIATLEGKPFLPFIFQKKGFLLSVGQYQGVGEFYGLLFDGFFAWWLKRTVYLFKIIGLLPKCKLAWEYTRKLFLRRKLQQQSL